MPSNPTNIFLFKVNNRNTRKSVFIVDFEQVNTSRE